MNCFFDNERPIYLQIVDEIKFEIVSGKLMSGNRIPSVRELAIKVKVNPNTMQRALTELENEGLIYTERTNGKFVTQDKKKIENLKKKMMKEKANNYFKDMKNIGVSFEEALECLKELEGEIDNGTIRM